MSDVRTWADGFGRWHARVSRNAAGPLIAARRAIRDELTARYGEVTPALRHFFIHLERRDGLSSHETVVYAEPTTDPDECDRCKGEVTQWTP